MSTIEKIKKQIAENPVLLYMKGTADEPKCGFSQAAVEALKQAGIEFAYIDVLNAPFIRERLPQVSNWSTFPQLFIQGELVGGSDVVCDGVKDGSLQQLYQDAVSTAGS